MTRPIDEVHQDTQAGSDGAQSDPGARVPGVSTGMRVPLQTWYDAWLEEHESTNLIYAKSGGDVQLPQVHFVRDTLARLIWRGIKYDDIPREPERLDCAVTAYVISEHRSKSVRLPVYSLERSGLGLQIVLRDNYYNWNVSVVSERPVAADLRGFVTDFRDEAERAKYRPRDCWGCCFFEGFPAELMLGPYSKDRRKFSLWTNGDHELYALVRNLMLEAAL